MPTVSICIPAYNQVEFLQKAIDSALAQTYKDFEIVITDDSPTEIVRDLVSAYKSPQVIKYYKNNYRLGTPENWNEAIRKSSGKFIKILHHDDWFTSEESLKKYVEMLENNPDCDFAFSATTAVNPGIEEWNYRVSNSNVDLLKRNPLLLYGANLVGAPSTTIFRKDSGLMFDSQLRWLVDIEYYIRMIDKNKNIRYSQELLVITCLAKGRVSEQCFDNKEVEVFEYFYLLNKIYERKRLYKRSDLISCLLKAIAICDKYNLSSRKDIIGCGYQGFLPKSVRRYLFFKANSPELAKVYRLMLRGSRKLRRLHTR